MKFEDAAVRYPTNGVLELAIKQRKCVELTLSASDGNTSKGIVHILIVRYFLSVTISRLFFSFLSLTEFLVLERLKTRLKTRGLLRLFSLRGKIAKDNVTVS